MATVDTSIPMSGYQPQTNNMAQLFALMQEKRRENALKGILSAPDATDPTTGMPTKNALTKIMQIDPKTGMNMLAANAKLQTDMAEGQRKEMELYQPLIEKEKLAIANILGPRIKEYGIEEAVKMSAGDYAQSIANLKATGVPDTILGRMPQQLTPALAQNFVAASRTPEQLALDEDRDATRDQQVKRDEEIARHNKASEAIQLTNQQNKGWTFYSGKDGKNYRANANSGKYQEMNAETGEWFDIKGLPKDVGKIGTASPEATLSEGALRRMAEQYVAGDKSVFQNLGRGAQGAANVVALREMVDAVAAEKNISGSEQAAINADFMAQGAALRSLAQRHARIGSNIVAADKAAGLLKELSPKVYRTDFVPYNKVMNAWRENTGDVETRQLGAALNTFLNEYATAVAGNQGMTVSGRQHAEELLSAADGPEAFEGVIGILRREMQMALEAPEQMRDEIMAKIIGHKGDTKANDKFLEGPSEEQLPAAARSHLKEGVITTFGNGQKWTLENGVPKKVE